MKQTSIEWLDEKLQDTMYIQYGYYNGVRKITIPLEDYMKLKQEANKMFEQQIIDAHNQGYADGYRDNGSSPIDYFTETFKK